MNESGQRQEGPLRPLLLLGSGVALFAAAGALLPAGLHALGLLAGSTATARVGYAGALLVGLALAAWWSGSHAGAGRSPLARLVLAECLAAAALAAAPILLGLARIVTVGAWPLAGGTVAADLLLRFIAASIAVMPAAVAVGLVLVHLMEVVRREDPQGQAAGGFTLGLAGGAVALGMVCGGILVQPALGARGAFLVAVALAGLGAAAGVLALRLGEAGSAPGDSAVPVPGPLPGPVANPAWRRVARLVAPFLAGAGLAAAFVAWHRIAGLLAGPTEVTTLACLIAVALGLALGGFASSGLRLPAVPWLGAAFAGAAGGAVFLSMQMIPSIALTLLGYAPQGIGRPVVLSLLAAGMLSVPASLLAGWALAAPAGRGREAGGAGLAAAPHARLLFGSLGAALGAGTAALGLVPAFGLRRTLAIAAAALLVGAAAALAAAPGLRTIQAAGALLLAIAGVSAALSPSSWDPRVVAGGIYRYGAGAPARFGSTEQWLAARLRGEGPRFYREGSESTVVIEGSVQTTPGLPPIDTFTLTLDGRTVAGTGTDLRTQVLTGAIPPLLHGSVKKALLVNLLTGVTAGSILAHPIESLTVIEPEAAVAGAAALLAGLSNRPLEDARLRLVHDDARARLVADPAGYDLIVVAQADPSRPEAAALLTSEGYALARRRLNPEGLFALRIALGGLSPVALPIVLRTFAQAFPSALVFALTPDDLLLVGADRPLRLDGGRLREVVGSNPAVADDLRRAVVVGANEVIMTLRLDRDALLKVAGAGPIDHDDTGLVAAMAARHLEVQHHEGLMAALDAAWPGFEAVLEHYGETSAEQGDYLYSLAKSYLGISADPVRALDLAGLLDAAGQPVKAHWVRGEALLQRRDLDGAVREWKAALAGDPHNIDALFSLGTFHLDGRDYQLAESYLMQAAREHADSRVVRYHYGRALYNLGRYQRAIEELERATAGEAGAATYPLAGYYIGLSESQLKHDDRAIAALKDYLAWAYKQSLLTRVELDAHLKLAEVYDRKGRRFDGLQERQKAERLRRMIEAYAAQHPAEPAAGAEPGAPASPEGVPVAPPTAPAPEHGG